MIGNLLSAVFWPSLILAVWWFGYRRPDADVESVERRERALEALARIGEEVRQ